MGARLTALVAYLTVVCRMPRWYAEQLHQHAAGKHLAVFSGAADLWTTPEREARPGTLGGTRP